MGGPWAVIGCHWLCRVVLMCCCGSLAKLGSDGRTMGSQWVSLAMPTGVDVLRWLFSLPGQRWADHGRSLGWIRCCGCKAYLGSDGRTLGGHWRPLTMPSNVLAVTVSVSDIGGMLFTLRNMSRCRSVRSVFSCRDGEGPIGGVPFPHPPGTVLGSVPAPYTSR